ncbi:ferrous iron transport protein B [Pelosinus sp. sgz500959]|uniref:ferrous iron transport protein B n=1 Tax=Pelosinus sp. sgz500959 TaxID=3242472 RepID=UPI003670A03D
MGDKNITVALVGNPNSGKTTIFNNLTGGRQHVGNYPGVTVEKKEGYRKFKDNDFLIVDLPGTYSLTAYSLEEVVTRNFIVNDKPDMVIDILDTSNLERNLYLTVQLLELERPVVLALNMIDVADASGLKINDQKFSERLGGIPVVRTNGVNNKGMEELLNQIPVASGNKSKTQFKLNYGTDIEEAIQQLEPLLAPLYKNIQFPVRWLALKLLENDSNIIDVIKGLTDGKNIVDLSDKLRAELLHKLGEDVEVFIAGQRYQFVGKVYQHAVDNRLVNKETVSDKIDRVLTNRMFGLPIFFALMWIVFNLVFTLGNIPADWIDAQFGLLGKFLDGIISDGPLKSLLVDGVVGGVGSVLVFVPNILLLFLAIAILEDTGYMARAAFIMDRVMRRFGLHGKSFIPLLLGFGCSATAMMGTRTLENPRDRVITMLVTPLMSCSAKLPVYTILIAAFFDEKIAGNVLFSIYFLGIILSMLMAWLFRSTFFQGESEPFVMELPPYRIPTAKSVIIHMWERSTLYLKKAGTIILAASILMWFLTTYPKDIEYSKDYDALVGQAEEAYTQQVNEEVFTQFNIEELEQNEQLAALVDEIQKNEEQFAEDTKELDEDSSEYAKLEEEKTAKNLQIETENSELYPYASKYVELTQQLNEKKGEIENDKSSEQLEKSYAGQFGKAIEPAIRPLGFDWRVGISLVSGVTAKEVVISTMGTIYSLGSDGENAKSMTKALQKDENMNPLVAYSLMVFVLIYSPCLAALAVMRRETNSWKWPAVSMVYSTTLAWIVTFIVYQGGRLLGFGG